MSLYRFLVLILLSISACLSAQNDYRNIQQHVAYDIYAQLDTLQDKLHSECTIKYTNNSSVALDTLYFHLWWNALSDKRSDWAGQMLESGDRSFHFSENKSMGGYEFLEIKSADGKRIEYNYLGNALNGKGEIIAVHLVKPLLPGDATSLKFKYILQIPFAHTRFGKIEGSYRMTYWYPTPAVYDAEGWHLMHYNELSETYSEFADFQVKLHLPLNYIPAHTGQLQRSVITDIGKEYFIKAKDVIDFGWFASPKYRIEEKTEIIDDKEIKIKVFRKDDNGLWDKAMDYTVEALKYYSTEVGRYPYGQISIVQGQEDACCAMEYPMLAIIDNYSDSKTLDNIINHEVGHNWFYSALSNNQRAHAWIDEGIISYYDARYIQLKYGIDEESFWLNDDFIDSEDGEYSSAAYDVMHLRNLNLDVALCNSARTVGPYVYYHNNYVKTPVYISYLAGYLGHKVFSSAVGQIYERYANHHLSPDAVQSVFEDVSGDNLTWFFNELLCTDKRLDYKLERVSRTNDSLIISVKNIQELEIPFEISLYDRENQLLQTKWCIPIKKGDTKDFSIDATRVDRVSINGEHPFIDCNRDNNHWYANKSFGLSEPLKVSFGPQVHDSRVNRLMWMPALNFNAYDGLTPSLLLSNNIFPIQNFRWFTSIGYGIKSQRLSGILSIEKDILPDDTGKRWTLGLYARRFNYNSVEDLYDLGYGTMVPSLRYSSFCDFNSNWSVGYKAHLYNIEQVDFSNGELLIDNRTSIIHHAFFEAEKRYRLTKDSYRIDLDFENYNTPFEEVKKSYLRLSTKLKKEIWIAEDSKFSMRLFGGYFLLNDLRQSSNYADEFARASFALSAQGFSDFRFDDYYFGRSNQSGFLSRQVEIADGGFKNAFGSSQKIGMSNDWMISVNLKTELPWGILRKVRIQPFLDMALSSAKDFSNQDLQTRFYYSAGILWEAENAIGIYVPLFYSDELKQAYNDRNILSRISFRISLDAFNWWQAASNPTSFMD